MRIKWFTSAGGFTDSVCKVLKRPLQNAEEAKVMEHSE